MYQKYVVVGRLTKDGENRFLPNGTQIYKNSIATDRKFKKQDGTQGQETMFMDFNVFGGLANTMNTYLHKGSLVLLEGYIQLENWTANDGTNRSKHSLRVETMKMLDSKSDSNNNHQNSGYNPSNYAGQEYANRKVPEKDFDPSKPDPAMNQYIPEIDIDDDEIPF